jgi:hypothetical protein
MPHETWPTYETRDPADPANMIYGYKRDDGDIHWEIRHPDCSTTIIGTLNDMADAKARGDRRQRPAPQPPRRACQRVPVAEVATVTVPMTERCSSCGRKLLWSYGRLVCVNIHCTRGHEIARSSTLFLVRDPRRLDHSDPPASQRHAIGPDGCSR